LRFQWAFSVIFLLVAVTLAASHTASAAPLLADDPTLVSVDEAAPESDAAHNSDPGADLTNMYARLEGAGLDTLVIALDFTSSWSDMHVMVVLERNGDSDGAPSDAFEFPVDYGHDLKPDYVFTLKYSAQDYADLRRWGLGGWEFWQPGAGSWTTNPDDPNKNSMVLTTTTGTQVEFRFPAAAIGALEPGDTLRLQAYVTQEPQGTKYTALDSNPHDATQDMLPDTGEWWETAMNPVSLSEYAVFELPAVGAPPALSQAAASPDTILPGDEVLVSVMATDAGGGIGDVYADLSTIGGDAVAYLTDDGTGGDQSAGDGVYSVLFRTPGDLGGGAYTIGITATDTSGIARSTTETGLVVTSEGVVFLSVEDAEGDDHGPNQEDIEGLYYLYPTNSVFKPGVFDLLGADFILDGRNLVIRVHIGNVLSRNEADWSPNYPDSRCGNPNRAPLSLEKIDIYVDASEGVGATAGLPSRHVDIAEWDAWDYTMAIDGWVVELIRSNGSNSSSAWTRNRNDIYICNDHVEEYVDIIVGLEALDLLLPGESLDEAKRTEIQDAIRQWEFIITMGSFDGYSPGLVRTVNRGIDEWAFGGGSNAVGGREPDPNLVDVLTLPGEGRIAGRSQEQMLNYLTGEADARFNSGLNSCVLEATPEFEGRISGTVTLSDPTDTVTVATVKASRQGEVFAAAETPPGGGAYVLDFLPDGDYAVSASAPYYLGGAVLSVSIEDWGSVEDVDLEVTALTGTIAGEVILSDPGDVSSVVAVTAYLDGDAAKTVEPPPGGGRYELRFLEPGSYDVEAAARLYKPNTIEGINVTAGSFTDNQDFPLTLVTGTIRGTVGLSGPEMDARVFVRDVVTQQIAGDSAIVIAGGNGPFEFLIIEDGSYRVVAESRGYVRFDSLVTVAGGDTASADIALLPAIATRYVFIDSVIDVAHAATFDTSGSLGNEIYSRSVSRSLPDDEIYFFTEVRFEPRDEDKNAAIFDGAALDSVVLSVSQLDTAVPPRGVIILADSADPGRGIPDNILTQEMFDEGVGRFFVSGDSIEVLRVEAVKGTLSGALEVGVGELEPAKVSLIPDKTESTVGRDDRIEVAVRIIDVRGNEVPEPDVLIRMQALEGTPKFEPDVGGTDANGFFKVFVSTLVSGTVRFTAQVEPGAFEGLPADTVEIVFNPGPPHEFTARLVPTYAQRNGQARLDLQLVDAYGNSVDEEGVEIGLTGFPEGLLASIETPVYTDAGGGVTSIITAGDRYGIVTIAGISTVPVPSLNLKIDAGLVAVDEEAPESDSEHNSNADVDLTTMFAALSAETLTVTLDFASPWGDVLLAVILETNGDTDGASQDAFLQPIYYEHNLKPDYVFTTKYSAEDYADLRRWRGGAYEYWHLANAGWIAEGGDEKKAISMVTRTDEQVLFRFPLTAIGQFAPGDTIRMQAYVSQETGEGVKYNALDSTPHDATHDMEPPSGSWWESAEADVNLSEYGLFVVPEAAVPPALSQARVNPDSAQTGDDVRFSVRVGDVGGGIGDVYADLTPVFGDAVTRLKDDGTGGDNTADDGTYSILFTVPQGVQQGSHIMGFTGKDSLNVAESHATASLKITTPPELIVSVVDSIGDDHGPNQTDEDGNPIEGLYYFYPTNGVFSPGVYDIEQVDLFIDGAFLVMRVHVGEMPSSDAVGWNAPNPGVTCTNPNKADLNLQKVDVYIDTKERVGATAGLPFRYLDISMSDAWEYAVAIEGWYRALIESNGQNSISFWTLNKQTSQIDFCNDHVENYIDIKISLEALGDPSVEAIRKWDFVITLASHDGDSNDQTLGRSRKVNQATSEWEFGGGRDGEAERERDANIMDVVTIVGEGKEPGRPQEEMLDYDTPAARNRFDNNNNAVVLEATFSEDISPPIITPFATDGFAHNVWYVMEHAPASFWTLITDQSTLTRVEFYWRPLGAGSVGKVDMVNLTGAYWIADIDPDDLRSSISAIELVDGTLARPFEAWIEAEDEFGNTAGSPLFTFAIPDENLQYVVATGLQPGATAVLYDGTIISIPESWSQVGPESLNFVVVPLGLTGQYSVDISGARSSMTYLDVARWLAKVDLPMDGIVLTDEFIERELPKPVTLTLHYPTYDEPGNQKNIGVFQYEGGPNRWITVFGQVNERGNAVSADTRHQGTYALFTDSRLGYDFSEGLSGVLADPNPFSPNGDGLYDETRLGFFLSREADWVTVEIYDVSGQEVRTIRWQQGLTTDGRNSFEIVWDGRDDEGELVPYGIYVARVEVRFKVAPYNERKNIPLVVIK